MLGLWIAIFLLFLTVILFFAIGFIALRRFAKRDILDGQAFRQDCVGSHRDWILAQNPEQLTIESRDGLKLYGSFLSSGNRRKTTVVLVHGYLGNGIDHMGMFVPFYLEQGFDVFLPDNRAHGKSEGSYIGFGEPDSNDCIDWCRHLLTKYEGNQKILLHGISMGGATVDTAAGRPDLPQEVIGVISDCAFSSCVEQFTSTLKTITPLSAKLILPSANIWCRLLAGYDFYQASATNGVRNSSLPFLFIHGADDTFVPTKMVYTLFDACKDPEKVLWIVPDAKHFVSYDVNPKEYQEKLLAFFKRLKI